MFQQFNKKPYLGSLNKLANGSVCKHLPSGNTVIQKMGNMGRKRMQSVRNRIHW